jgi:hypothetical protein
MRIRRLFHTLLLFFVVMTFHACYFFPIWENWVSIDVENHSEDSILVYLASGKTLATPTVYPDTCLPAESYVGDIRLPHTNDSISGYLVRIAPHEIADVYGGLVSTDYWGHSLKNKFFEEHHISTLSFFFIHADSIKKYGYDHIARNNLILARYDLSVSDMRALDLRIPYPPSNAMKGMRMWLSSDAISGDG